MNKYLQQLVELSHIDKEIDGFAPRIESVERVLRATKDEKEAVLNAIANISEAIDEISAQKSQVNVHIAEFGIKIKDVSKKSGLAKTEKEIKALGLEEEIAKEQLEAANEEIVRLEKLIENKSEQKAELESSLAEIDQRLAKNEAEISSEVANIEKERTEVYAKKDEIVTKMNQKILSFYEKIRKWAGNTAVVPVKNQACYGCFMRINDKTFASVLRGEDIITCPHCGRILYKETKA